MTSASTGISGTCDAATRVIPGGVNGSIRILGAPIAWERAEGARLVDEAGRSYLDFHNGYGAIILGHCHPAINQAVFAALGRIDLVGAGVTASEVRLAEKIVRHVPAAEMVHLCNSGSEATYHVVRLSRAATGREHVVKFQGCYHGWHDYLLQNVFSPAERIGMPDPGSAGTPAAVTEKTLALPFNDIDAAERLIRSRGDEIAAVVLEMMPHNVGCILPRTEFLQALRRLCDEKGIVLVFDEVITGFRHGLGGYQEKVGITPDLTTLAKAMSNGYPCAAIAGRRELMSRFSSAGGDVYIGGTYQGHPGAVSAAGATIEALEDGTVHEHIFRLGDKARRGLAEIAARRSMPMTVSGYGSIFVVYFLDGPVTSYTDLLRNDRDRWMRFTGEMIRRGVFMMPLPLKRCHVTAAHTDEDIDRMLETAEDVLKEMDREG